MDFALADCEVDERVQRFEGGFIERYALYPQWRIPEI